MKVAHCMRCGARCYEVQSKWGSSLVDTQQVERGAYVVKVRPVGGIGTEGTYALHKCKGVKYPPKRLDDAMNRALRAVGADPLPPQEE